jgi:hypothetical protein
LVKTPKLRFILCAAVFAFIVLATNLVNNPTTFLKVDAAQTDNVSQLSPRIQNYVAKINDSQSRTIFIPVDNLGSSLNWTDLRLAYVDSFKGIKVSTDPLLFVDSLVPANSDNYTLRVGIAVSENMTVGVYSIPFTITGRSSFLPPFVSLSIGFNVTVIVSSSPPVPISPALLFPPFILISALVTIGIVIAWSRDWNLSEVKK